MHSSLPDGLFDRITARISTAGTHREQAQRIVELERHGRRCTTALQERCPGQSFFAGEQRTPQARPVNSDHAWGRRAGGNMLKGVLIATALGLGALLAPDFAGAAPGVSKIEVPSAVTEVGRRHHHRWHGHRHHRRGWHRHSGFRFYLGPRRYYGSGCGWLRHRAAVTGSSYWWRRYRHCRGW